MITHSQTSFWVIDALFKPAYSMVFEGSAMGFGGKPETN